MILIRKIFDDCNCTFDDFSTTTHYLGLFAVNIDSFYLIMIFKLQISDLTIYNDILQ